jgi:hypothetical protein
LYHTINPNPGFFSESTVDGGLLIVSRLPIVESNFLPFKVSGVQSDLLAYKGALYAKVSMESKGGKFLHIVTTHT